MATSRIGRVVLVPGMLRAAWRYRRFIVSSIRNDYRSRFARSRLGTLWMVLHPLANAAIFALVLSEVMAAKLPGMGPSKFAYATYLMSGILGWSLFAEVVTRCLTIFIDNGSLLKKQVFPRICLPLIVTGSALLNNLLLFAAILLIFSLAGFRPHVEAAWVPVLMLVPLALGLGSGLLLGVFNVFVRDIGQVVPVVLQLLFWFTPIVYTRSALPADYAWLLGFNPMAPVVAAYQGAMVYGRPPEWPSLAIVGGTAMLLLAVSLFLFRRANVDLVDAL
jgi:lipopolysaccharide transport system permease protein